MLLPAILLCVSFVLRVNADDTAPRVGTLSGRLKGSYKVSQHGRKYEAYEGIPYALPPVGVLRFEPPQQMPPWFGELSATSFGSQCLQRIPIAPDEVLGDEDCLYLNIYVPVQEENKNETLLPVLFFIHGGIFQFGSGSLWGAQYLMDYDVILVTINYRLGPMGFLSTENYIVPGNMGLKDQVIALRWVSKNIEFFGGNPDKVTLVGQCAGGASVQYHYLSKMSENLFQGGISISGTALDCWAQTENSLEKAKKLSTLVNCSTSDITQMIYCLKNSPSHKIIQATSEFMTFYYTPFTPFGPVVENNTFKESFIDRPPVDILNDGDIQDLPWITGTTTSEGLFPVSGFIENDSYLQLLNNSWESIAPTYLDFNYTIPVEEQPETARRIREYYFDTKPIDRQNAEELIQMTGDRLFVLYTEKAARMQAKANKKSVQCYRFNYRGAESLTDHLTHTNKNYGVSHLDDIAYIFDNPWMNQTTTQRDRDMQKRLINFWIHFATEGEVIPTEWPEVDPSEEEFNCLHIASPDDIYMDSDDNLGNKTFWYSINFNENVL